jgi:hypothetical protein
VHALADMRRMFDIVPRGQPVQQIHLVGKYSILLSVSSSPRDTLASISRSYASSPKSSSLSPAATSTTIPLCVVCFVSNKTLVAFPPFLHSEFLLLKSSHCTSHCPTFTLSQARDETHHRLITFFTDHSRFFLPHNLTRSTHSSLHNTSLLVKTRYHTLQHSLPRPVSTKQYQEICKAGLCSLRLSRTQT